jgi:hypothetical protein
MLCSFVDCYQRLGGTYRLHLWTSALNMEPICSSKTLVTSYKTFLICVMRLGTSSYTSHVVYSPMNGPQEVLHVNNQMCLFPAQMIAMPYVLLRTFVSTFSDSFKFLSFPVVIQFWENLGCILMRGFETVFVRQLVGLLGRGVVPSQGLYLHRIAQHRKTKTIIHTLNGIRTHDPRIQAVKPHDTDRPATVTGRKIYNASQTANSALNNK